MKRVKVSSPPLVNLDLNSTDGSKPRTIKEEIGNGNGNLIKSETSLPLPVLPEEIWLHIFTLVDNNKDLQNITLTSPTFSKYLQKQKPTFLFKKIVPILCHHENGLDKQTLLLLRETCKTWRHSIDTFLECESQRKPFDISDSKDNLNLTYDPETQKLKSFTFTSPWDLQKLSDFVRKMGNGDRHGNRNPFVGRCLDLEILPVIVDLGQALIHPEIEVAFDLDLRLDAFFSPYGHHLWHVKIYDDSGLPLTAIQFYTRFHNLLDQLPSIRSLSFTVTHLTSEDPADRRERQRGRQELERFMDEHPLPAIPVPFLEALEVNLGSHVMNIAENPDDDDDDNPEDDLEDLMLEPCCFMIQKNIFHAYAQQLKKLCIDWGVWIGWHRIPNVTELRFRNILSNQDLSSLVRKVTASYEQNSLPKLVKLDLQFEYSRLDVNALMKMLRCLRKNSKLRVVKLIVLNVTEMAVGDEEGGEIVLLGRGCAEADFLVQSDDLILEGLEGKINRWLSVVGN